MIKKSQFIRAFALAVLAAMLFAMTACNVETEISSESTHTTSLDHTTSETVKKEINVLTIAGPTGIGMAKLMQDNADGKTGNDYQFSITSTPSDVLAAILSGSADIAACPINLASNIYAKTEGGVQILAINTLGVLYVITNGTEINDFCDLNGKTVITSGQGATPEFAMKYLAEAYEIEIDLQFVDEFATAAGMVAAGECEIALLAEPSVTSALMKNSELNVAINLTQTWREAGENGKIANVELAQGCVVVRKEFAEQNPDAIRVFLEEYNASVSYMNEAANLDAAATLCETYKIVPKAAIAKKAIPNCNLVCITGEEMKAVAKENLNVFFHFKPASIGGDVPSEDFYYEN